MCTRGDLVPGIIGAAQSLVEPTPSDWPWSAPVRRGSRDERTVSQPERPVSGRARVATTIAAGGLVILGALLAVVLQAPPRVVSDNGIGAEETFGELLPRVTVCQAGERLPAGTAAVRISTGAYVGPAVSVEVVGGGRVLARGQRGSGWIASSLTFPLRPALAQAAEATLCLRRDSGSLAASLIGSATGRARAATADGSPLPGRMRVEYLAAGNHSWLALARHVARRMGLGHAPSGGWIVIPLFLLMALASVLAAWLMVHTQDERDHQP